MKFAFGSRVVSPAVVAASLVAGAMALQAQATSAPATAAPRQSTTQSSTPSSHESSSPAPQSGTQTTSPPGANQKGESGQAPTPASPDGKPMPPAQQYPGQAEATEGTQAPPPTTPQGPKVGADGVVNGVKAGSIDDVNAVGTRNIGGRGLGNWYSTESEIREGKAFSMELEKSVKFITDPVVTEYVNRVGQNIVKNSDAKVPFTIKVIDSDQINAMALPGGFFYVNSGLILNADDEAEMAGVMAHEIGHVAAHHAMREQTRMNYAQFGTIPLIFVGGGIGYAAYEAANVGIPLTFLQFSRDFERQADFLGIEYMYRAGYDPDALVAFFEKVGSLEKTKPGIVAKAFDTHPQTPDRIDACQKEIAQLLPAKQEYVVTTSEFNDVKARLARIENKRKLRDGGNANKPSLRRASTSPTDNTGGTPSATGSGTPGTTTTTDDRPTLHRRDN